MNHSQAATVFWRPAAHGAPLLLDTETRQSYAAHQEDPSLKAEEEVVFMTMGILKVKTETTMRKSFPEVLVRKCAPLPNDSLRRLHVDENQASIKVLQRSQATPSKER